MYFSMPAVYLSGIKISKSQLRAVGKVLHDTMLLCTFANVNLTNKFSLKNKQLWQSN